MIDLSIFFADKTWPEIEEAQKRNTLIILPVGMMEQHSYHLPVSTDTIIASEVSRMVAERIKDKIPVLVLPAIWTGYHGNAVAKWPGSVRIQPETLIDVTYEVCSSLCKGGFKKIVIINGHGQNPAMLEIVCRKIADNYDVNPILTIPTGMIGKEGANIRKSALGGAGSHAEEIETSLILALKEELVDMSKAHDDTATYKSKFVAGDMYPEHDVIKSVYWSTFNIQKTESGAIGNPKPATKEAGEKFLKLIIDNYVELMEEYYAHPGHP